MAHVKKKEIDRKDGSITVRWQAIALDQFGVEHARNHPTKQAAEEDAYERQRLMRREWADPTSGKMPLSQFVEEIWLPTRIWKLSTVATVESKLRNHILPEFGHKRLVSIKPSQVQAWVKQLDQRLSPTTVAGLVDHLKAILDTAVDDGFLPTNPCTNVKTPAVYKKKVKPISETQAAALLQHTEPRFQALVAVQMWAGLRVSEALGLGTDQINFGARLIMVDRQLVHRTGGSWEFVEPKTRASVREVPFGERLEQVLRAHISLFEPDTELLFTNTKGGPVRRSRVSDTILKRAFEAAQIPRVTAHDLRHFFASLLINAGLSVKPVQEAMGHASARETTDTYGHLWHDDQDKIRSVIDARFSPSKDGQDTDSSLADNSEEAAQSPSEAA